MYKLCRPWSLHICPPTNDVVHLAHPSRVGRATLFPYPGTASSGFLALSFQILCCSVREVFDL